MSVYRSDLRQALRDKLSTFARLSTTLNGAITSSATSLILTSGTRLEDRMILEIESEIIEVVAFSSNTASEVIRGARGSTAASHADLAAVAGFPFWGWTSAHLNRQINDAIQWLSEECWTLVPYTNTWLSGYREFGLPSGVTYPTGSIVKKIEMQDSSDIYHGILGWRHIGDRIIITSKLTKDETVRIWVQSRQATLSDDSTALNDDKFKEALVLYAAARCLDELLANRSRYYEYSASLNDRASTADELQRVAYFYFNQATLIRSEMSRPGLSGYAAIIKE